MSMLGAVIALRRTVAEMVSLSCRARTPHAARGHRRRRPGSRRAAFVLLLPRLVSGDSVCARSGGLLSSPTISAGSSARSCRGSVALVQEQMRRLANNDNGGLLTFGVAGAQWGSSSALVSIVGARNRAYHID